MITLQPAAEAVRINGIDLAWFHPLGADKPRRSPMPTTSPRLPFEIDDTIDPTLVTGRAGVPLVLIYPKSPTANAIVLPDVLTPNTILDALDRAAK